MSRRIMTTENLEEDVRIENHLRPQLLEDYIGQTKAKEMLKIYIEAAKAVGASDFRIIFKYILPNSMAPIIVQVTLGVAGAILSIAGLSFLGLGIQPPTPEWGAMLSGARSYIRSSWHITIIPGLAIMLTILALNVMGDGLRDALDPRLKN